MHTLFMSIFTQVLVRKQNYAISDIYAAYEINPNASGINKITKHCLLMSNESILGVEPLLKGQTKIRSLTGNYQT